MLRSLSRLALVAATLVPGVALAHTGVGATGGFVHGFAHPIGGLDHVLAMVLVGVFAWQLGGRALWLVPAVFVGVMALGGILGVAGMDVPFVEVGIALSVVVLGAVVAIGVKAPVAVAMALAGLFAIFHGHAHGTELPESANAMTFAAGFVIATGLLHLAGIALGLLVKWPWGRVVVRAGGFAIALIGALFLVGVL